MPLSLDQHWSRELWVSPYRLRFELNTGGNYISMFTSSYDRARKLARSALATDRPMGVVAGFRTAFWTITGGDIDGKGAFDALKEMGVSTDSAEAVWEGYLYPDDESDDEIEPCEHRAASFSWDEADILLWNNIAQEIGVRPKAPVISTLVDREQSISVFAYDDRGMDITALSPEPLKRLYVDYEPWLLDYDRTRMAEIFAS